MNFTKTPSRVFSIIFTLSFVLIFYSNIYNEEKISKFVHLYLPEKIAPIWKLFSPSPSLSIRKIYIQCGSGPWSPLFKEVKGVDFIFFDKLRFSQEFLAISFAIDFDRFRGQKCRNCNNQEKEFVKDPHYLFYDNFFTQQCYRKHLAAHYYRVKLTIYTPPVFSNRNTNNYRMRINTFPKIEI